MAKFKVGDKVRILDGSKIPNYTGRWADSMKDHVGEVHTIKEVDDKLYDASRVCYRLNDVYYRWDERGLEAVNDKPETIVIYRKGMEVIALDKVTKQKAVAKCSPEDEFDFTVGAKLAFARLLAEQCKEPEEEKVTYLNTKICITKINGGTPANDLTVGRIYEIKDGCFRDDKGYKYPLGEPIHDIDDLRDYIRMSGNERKYGRNPSHYNSAIIEFVEVVE